MTENGKNYVQVEIPKVPRFISDILDRYKTRGYYDFRDNANYDMRFLCLEQYEWALDNRKTIDLAIALGVWEIDE